MCPIFYMPGTLPHENAFARTLLAWHIAKAVPPGRKLCMTGLSSQAARVPRTSRMSHISHVKSRKAKYLRNPTEMYIFSLLTRHFNVADATPHHLFQITLSHVPSDITPSVTNHDIVAHMNSVFTNSARLVDNTSHPSAYLCFYWFPWSETAEGKHYSCGYRVVPTLKF